MARKKNKSMRWQVEEILLPKLCIGQKKHIAKEQIKENAKANGEQKCKLDGIYSWDTYNTYKKHCIYFAEWAKKEHGCRTIGCAETYIQEYINERIRQGLSAWTIKMEVSAIARMYGKSSKELHLTTPDRKRKDIKQSRKKCEHDKHINLEKHKDIIDFCKGTGLRRHELAALKPEEIVSDGDKVFVMVLQG